jgi:hypothetical protein
MWNGCSEMRERERKERGEKRKRYGRGGKRWKKKGVRDRKKRVIFGIAIFIFVIRNPKAPEGK